ncbi:FtsX-like permease family protein [Pseudoduganella sp. FT25W]|jgi:putative ABC transport system permease protein|uniref:FtsX-like permease family protein n=1 Tax=Duganella alba TaxID=2666081 RepID=A0A6L5QDZ9_9BURK|nr:FtsX-like permease family protein [Duganella alba]MRX07975.1 FtsX-like permease family protein [Duganella alba]MRX16488.1 FtsX-like permease family protein [Duganella alba]
MEIRPILSALLRNKTGPILVAVQVALSLAILSNALYIVQDRQAMSARASGVANEEEVFGVQIRHLKALPHEASIASQRGEVATMRAVAGVTSVAQTSQMPLSRSGSYSGMATDRKQVNSVATASVYYVGDSLVKTLGLQLVEGRDFLPNETPEIDGATSKEAPKVAIITRALGAALWPDATSFIGKEVLHGTGAEANALRVVGVVEKLQTPNAAIGAKGEQSIIMPIRSSGDAAYGYTVRAEPGQLDRVIKETEAALRAASPEPIVVKTKTLSEYRQLRYRADMALAWMLVTVSVLLLLITASGIVGMASLWVTQRRKQIGVRRALGARRVDILRYFITENILITSAGIGAGVLLALGLNQLIVSKLEMARLPAGYLVGGSLIFWALGIIAVYGPAWRAASISPATATRTA